MISANEARQIMLSITCEASESKVFKYAVKKLDVYIKEASLNGKNEISYNNAFFDICENGKEEHATDADRMAIEWFMKEHGYHFFYHSMFSFSGRPLSWFTCRW